MLNFKERTDSWNQMMLAPSKTAALHAKRKELGFRDGLENFGTPVLMVYLPLLLITLVLSGKFEPIYLAAVLFSIASTILGLFLVSAAFCVMAYALASFLGGKAKIGRLYYMIGLAAAPTFVFTLVMNIASLLISSMAEAASFPLESLRLLQLAGAAVAISMIVYGCYLLTVSIAALYKFGMKKAFVSWFAPALVLLSAGAILFISDLFGILKFLLKTL